MKRKLQITLEISTAEMMDRANAGGLLSDVHGARWRQWLIQNATFAVAREIARLGEVPMPLAVAMRHESYDEVAERIMMSAVESRWRLRYRRFQGCVLHAAYIHCERRTPRQ